MIITKPTFYKDTGRSITVYIHFFTESDRDLSECFFSSEDVQAVVLEKIGTKILQVCCRITSPEACTVFLEREIPKLSKKPIVSYTLLK